MEKQIVEINGIKLEIDMRYAKKIEHYKVGDNVKVLIKKYSDSYENFPGVIVGFDQFDKLPTIIVCYVELSYNTAEIKFININANTKEIEIVHMQDHEKHIDKNKAIDLLDRMVLKAESDLSEIMRKRNYFLEKFDQNFNILEHDENNQLENY